MSKLLDLFSCAGGAGMGYHRAGFDVTGVDIVDQPNYPLRFIRGDALEYLAAHGHEFDFIHASPPCQHYSYMSACRPELAAKYPDLLPPIRASLKRLGVPYVIENVVGAPMRADLTLCGTMFDRPLYRHRLFEFSKGLRKRITQPEHPAHTVPASKAGHWVPGTIMSVAGHMSPIAHAREIMGIDWTNRQELAESIPPYYTEFIGRQVRTLIG